MKIQQLRSGIAWLAMVGMIMLGGLRVQANDDERPGSPADESSAKVREVKVYATTEPDGEIVEQRVIVVGADPKVTPDQAQIQLKLAVEKAVAASAANPQKAQVLRIDAKPAGDVLAVRVADPNQTQRDEFGTHWIGVHINDVSPALRSQLNLEKDRGVLIGEVLPESPASKAGIKQYDILLAIGETKVGRNEEVMKAVKEADGKELKLTLLRGGSLLSLTVTPAERPKSDVVLRATERPQDVAQWIEAFPQLRSDAQPGLVMDVPGLQFDVVKPGQAWLFPDQDFQIALPSTELPEDLKVSVTREGKQPAKITIRQDEREIETTEDKLDEVPEDLRKYVEPMLGRARAPWKRQATLRNDVLIPAPPGKEERKLNVRPLPPEGSKGGLEQRLEQLERRFKRLEQAFPNRDPAPKNNEK